MENLTSGDQANVNLVKAKGSAPAPTTGEKKQAKKPGRKANRTPSAEIGAGPSMRTLEIRGRRAIRATGPSQRWQKAVVLSQGGTGTLVGKCARLVGCASSMCQFMEPKGFYRSAGPLAQDAATAVASVTPAVEHDVTVREQLSTKAVGIKGAKESLKARVQKLENEEKALPKTARLQQVPKSTPPTSATASGTPMIDLEKRFRTETTRSRQRRGRPRVGIQKYVLAFLNLKDAAT